MKIVQERNKIIISLVLCGIVGMFISCNYIHNKAVKEKRREEIRQAIRSHKHRCPSTIPCTGFTMVDIDAEDDYMIVKVEVTNEYYEGNLLTPEMANSDRNVARGISIYSSNIIDMFIEYEFGMKYIYTSKETGKTLLEITIPPKKLKEVKEKVDKGELQAYSLLELMEMEFAKMAFPYQIEEGLWLTNVYIKGNNIFYVYVVENEIDASDVLQSVLYELRKSSIEGLRKEFGALVYKQSIIKENIHFVYIYKDNHGKEFARISISPDDLWYGNY